MPLKSTDTLQFQDDSMRNKEIINEVRITLESQISIIEEELRKFENRLKIIESKLQS